MTYLEPAIEADLGHAGLANFETRPLELKQSQSAKVQRHSQHSVIFYEGDRAERLFELDEGIVMLYKLLPDGRRQVVEILNPGTIFGAAAGETYDCSAETLTGARISAYDRREIDRSASLQRHLTKCLMSQMELMHDHAVLLGRKSAIERVSTFLMRMVPRRGGEGCIGPAETGADSHNVVLTMTRQEIADYLGLTIETVSRVISDLKRRGLIKVERQDQIHISRVCGICQLTGIH
ncbi:helix-turn-helix domain-containing protein [Stappia stellulata]|uniref:helix-turn-helix domain-containing protein n=1 Tax=Stappia TaxID=152161 RepID=UPI001CD200C6|nr:helix-turn-helix domain-containing protein [Stappia stellulata]MCA1243583.1 helix-turn-helix domain-containing protein [Stappia stellulata]|eukprot:jgi/Tetstr1/435280/TSEL_024199.t1